MLAYAHLEGLTIREQDPLKQGLKLQTAAHNGY